MVRRSPGSLGVVLPDYASYDQAIGLDWYDVDRNLRLLLDRLLPDADDRAFARKRLASPRARGILDDDRTAIDLFEPLVRYGPVEPVDAA